MCIEKCINTESGGVSSFDTLSDTKTVSTVYRCVSHESEVPLYPTHDTVRYSTIQTMAQIQYDTDMIQYDTVYGEMGVISMGK